MEAEHSRVNGLESIANELSELSYHNIDGINGRVQSIKDTLANLKELSDDRRARIEAAIANQHKLDALRLEFATNSAVSVAWTYMYIHNIIMCIDHVCV